MLPGSGTELGVRADQRRFVERADRMAGMTEALVFYVLCCFVICIIWVETIGQNGWRWTVADLLKLILLLSAMLAFGRMLAID
jgi:hypothetical protein